MKRGIVLVCIGLWVLVVAGLAQNRNLSFMGVVKDKETRKTLANVNISIQGTNVGTVTNADGVFSLKFSESESTKEILVSHLGYSNAVVSFEELSNSKKRPVIWLTPEALTLDMVNVFGGDPLVLVENALRKIAQNYPDNNHLFSAFYRETIQKRRRYIGVSEAVLNVYKSSYRYRGISRDRVQILKGRRLESQKKSDTLAVKIAGGPNIPVYLDVVKNQDALLDVNMLHCYQFSMQLPVSIDNRMQYVIGFQPRGEWEQSLYQGLLYIDQQTLAITRAEFQLDLSDQVKAVEHILRKKPLGLRFKLQDVSYLVTYKQQGGKTYLNYLRNMIRFKCDWKKRLFSSSFTTTTEMVMVDRDDRPDEPIRLKDAFRQKEIFYDVVETYWNEDFWKDYNIIEPTESLESAVEKLKKKKR